MTNISTWDREHSRIYFLNHKSLFTKLVQLIDISKGNIFQESFEQTGGLGSSSRSFQFRNLVQLHNNELWQDSSVSFSVYVSVGNTCLLAKKVIITDYHNIKLWYLEFSWNRYIELSSCHWPKIFPNSLKKHPKERFNWQSKTCEDSKKMREESNTVNLADMVDVWNHLGV